TWSINPNVGSISSTGVYTAPASIPTSQPITVTAASVVDSTRSASALVTLVPVSVTMTPVSATLFNGDTQQFNATVTGTTNTAVTWTISPNIGNITAGLYTAPNNISTTQTVTVTATSVADTTKFAFATITLSPPTPPNITQQPQNVGIFAGQTATFQVVATGGGLIYQWQVMPSGAAGFTNISGATASTYTTGATALTDNGTQIRCVVTNSLGTASSNPALLLVSKPSIHFVTSDTPGGLQNDFTGWVGMSVTVNAVPLTVTALGRIVATGNSGTHNVEIIDASSGTQLAQVTVNTATGTLNQFVYTPLQNPVTLNPNGTYYILSSETKNGEYFYNTATTDQTTSVAVLNGPVYSSDNQNFSPVSAPGTTYGPVDFAYNAPVSVTITPTTATLYPQDTQQFTATVTGNALSTVTWTITPNGTGSITAGGLYTAPATITASTPVTITATSVADSTKFAVANVTLSPPTTPAISHQPQSATVLAGQTAVFSLTATGGSLQYQWQSKPAGASGFTNISGATTNSYTTPATALTDSGTQFQCVITNVQGTVTSAAVILTVVGQGTNFVSSVTSLGNGQTFPGSAGGWVGMTITTGSAPLAITSLGRMVLQGNTGTHTLKIVDATTGIDVPGSSVTINTSGATAGNFAYGALQSLLILNPNYMYYVLSQETGSDQFYDSTTVVQTTSAATIDGPVYGLPGASYSPTSSPGNLYGPLDFSYTPLLSVTVMPTTVSLGAAQTQQFTATVSGSGNTGITWTLNPPVGMVTPAGLYTAPQSVNTTQTVTLTATSVADPTKFASATITLTPPAPPLVTLQPQNATVISGQTATFTVAGTGGNLNYQWQSTPSGSTVFTNIAGANAASYTTPALSLSNSATQFQCVITNPQGTVTSNAASVTVLPPGTNFVVNKTPGTLRNNFTGVVGMSITIGSQPVAVTSLGRIMVQGNSGTHKLQIIDASTGNLIPGAYVTVSMANNPAGSFVYGALLNPVTLNPNSTYYIVSQETSGQDQWYDLDTVLQTTSVATLNGPLYGTPYGLAGGFPGHSYVPLDFLYNVSVSVNVAPGTASLFGSQMQQFTATVTGSSAGVTWSLNPNSGTITPTGMYTAPATITTLGTVTVTATSVTDLTKFATAMVTLNPPAPPAITLQPQSTAATQGQGAVFSVTATGGGLTYQWQSLPAGGGGFANITGANSASYTTPPTAMTDNG
ncbi:MAG: hypothetical protein JO099_08045, partial [Acidobacteriia bacterium]|nr:hypothetical protein [Terriglobia bacterium]